MRLHLKVTEGPRKGQKISISDKKTFGRNGADIDLGDPKASGFHGYFEYLPEQGWFVVDNKSRNGIWLNELRENRALLKDGDILRVGGTHLLVRIFETGQEKFSEKLIMWVGSLAKQMRAHPPQQRVINPQIQLRFTGGVQYGETCRVFYGPRKAGRNSLDICLFDAAAPDEAFEIRVKGSYAYFYTEKKEVVKLNDESVKEKQFKPGDVISLGDTQILIEVDEGHGFSS